jgi:omega-6 fatty acid desaturase (delta-12 desaturase)
MSTTEPTCHGAVPSSFDRASYDELRRRLEFRPNLWMNCATLALNAALFGAALKLLTLNVTWAYWSAQALLPIVFFQAFSLLHDCGHGSCASTRLGNMVIGHYASVLCFLPFFPWKYVHTEHHVWAGTADHDPGLVVVKRARETGRLPWLLTSAWRTWLPIIGLTQHIIYWAYPITGLRAGKLSRSKAVRCAASVGWLGCVYAVAHHAAPTLIRAGNFLPAILLYLVLVELVNIPHHAGLTSFAERLPLWEQHRSTRSCDYPVLVSELLVLNFNFHIEHHMFPNLPWYRLRSARRLVKASLGSAYRETRAIRWQLQQRTRGLVDVLRATE